MTNRWIGIAALVFMLAVNAALLMRDLVPSWTAGDPPAVSVLLQDTGTEKRSQTGLFDKSGRRIGCTWTRSTRSTDKNATRSWTVLEALTLSADAITPRLLIDTKLEYQDDGRLESLDTTVQGMGMRIELVGQFVPPNDFPCEWQFGEQRGMFQLPGNATRATGNLLQPFENLSTLRVGQSWRVQMFNPLGGLLGGWHGNSMASEPIIVRVDRIEYIQHNNLGVKAFVIEAERLRAWVTPLGRVVRQEVNLPLLGTLTLEQEPYDDFLRLDSLRRVDSGR